MNTAAASAARAIPRSAMDHWCSWSYISLCILIVGAAWGAVTRESAEPSDAGFAAAGDAGARMPAKACTVADACFD